MIAAARQRKSMSRGPAHRKAMASALKANRNHGHKQAMRRTQIASGAPIVKGEFPYRKK